MAMNDTIMGEDQDLYLLIKKGQFDALKDGISRLGEAQVRRMATYWLGSQDALIEPLDEVVARLKDAMSTPGRLASVLDFVPKRSYDLMHYVASEGGSLFLQELKTGFPLRKGENVRSAIQPLTSRGLLWELRSSAKEDELTRLHLLNTCAAFLHAPAGLEGKLGALLPRRSKDQLHALVEMLGGDAKALSRSRETVYWLKTQLRNPVRMRRLFESFNLNTRKLLKILALHPQGMTGSRLQHEFALFAVAPGEGELDEILNHLSTQIALIEVRYPSPEIGDKRAKEPLYRLPREITHLIRTNFKEKYSDAPPPVPVFKAPDEDFALGSRSRERSELWVDFQQLLNHLVRCEVGVIRKGGMHKKNLKRILDRLEARPVDAYHYLDFLFLYCYERDILHPESERWNIRVEKLLPIQTEAAFCRDFWMFYRNNASWNDRDSSPLQGVLQKGDSAPIFSLRRAVLRMLQECQVGQWIETRVFFDHLMDREEAFHSGELPLANADPLKEKYRFMKSTLERSLSWLGIVNTTTVASRRLDLFRLTEIGSWLLSGAPDKTPFASAREEQDSLTVQPNLEVIVPARFPLEKQLYLARFTDDHKGRIIINRAAIRRGLESGLSAREMTNFLEQYCSGAIPPNVGHIIQEVVGKTGSIVVDEKCLKVSDQMLLDELLEQNQFTQFIQERADDKRAFLRRGADVEKLLEELRSAGYPARMT